MDFSHEVTKNKLKKLKFLPIKMYNQSLIRQEFVGIELQLQVDIF